MGDPLGVAFQALALSDFLLEPPLGLLAGRDVLHREEDELDRIEAAAFSSIVRGPIRSKVCVTS